MTRTEARMVAEELIKLIKPQIIDAVREEARECADKWIDSRQAAQILGWELKTLYNRIGEIPHVKNGKKLRFSERALNQYLRRE